MVKPGLFTNEELAEIPPLGRLLFIGLWGIADREGRLEDRPKRIKAELLPYDVANVEALLSELDRRDFIRRYVVDGAHYIQVTNFKRHQTPHIKEPASHIPAPPDRTCHPGGLTDKHGASTVQEPGENHTSTPLTESLTDTESDTETWGARARDAAGAAASPAPPSPPKQSSPSKKSSVEQPTPEGFALLTDICEVTNAAPRGDQRRRDALHADELLRRCGGDAAEALAYVQFRLNRGDSPQLQFAARDYAPGWRKKAEMARAGPGGRPRVSTADDFAALALRLEAEGR